MFLASFYVLGPFDKSCCQNWLKLASKEQNQPCMVSHLF